MDYKIPFKKKKSKKNLFLKTLQEMLVSNDKKQKNPKKNIKKLVKKYVKVNGRKYLIHIGKKGGKYYIKNKKKHYLKKDYKLIGGNEMTGGNSPELIDSITAAALFMLSKWLKDKNNIKRFKKK